MVCIHSNPEHKEEEREREREPEREGDCVLEPLVRFRYQQGGERFLLFIAAGWRREEK